MKISGGARAPPAPPPATGLKLQVYVETHLTGLLITLITDTSLCLSMVQILSK